MRALDRKLDRIRAGTDTPADFVLADAKDADMAFGLAAAGPVPRPGGPASDGAGAGAPAAPPPLRTRRDYLAAMAELVVQGKLDIVLTSAGNGERLITAGVLDGGDITLAVRANDSTDVWFPRGGGYAVRPSRPFRGADLELVRPFCDLVLYSVTFNNDPDADLATLRAYAEFRAQARALGMRHLLEVFNPNAPVELEPDRVGEFVNDSIVRTLAGLTAAERPLFLKIAYNGPRALAELARHDPDLVVGVLGGSAGTTRDTLELLHAAQRDGARVALFGRKIQRAESQTDLVTVMRRVLDGELSPADGVRAYHAALRDRGLAPVRDLPADLEVTEPTLRQD